MGDKVYSFDDHDCFECFQFKCDANSCPHHIGTGFGARESKLKNRRRCNMRGPFCQICKKFIFFGELFIQNS